MASKLEDRAAAVRSLERKEAWRRRLPLLPALIFTIIVTQVPFVFSLFYSLTRWVFNKPLEPREFIGIDNYKSLTETFGFTGWDGAVWTTVVMTLASVFLSVFVGTCLALLLDRKFFGQGFIRTLLITPFLVMPVVAGYVWTNQMFSATFGVLNWLLDAVGFERIEFVSRFPLWSIIAVLVWQWSPFMMLIVLAGLQGQDASVLEAARVDGAKPFAIFRQITFPQLRPFLELGTLLGAIYLIQVFDHVAIMTGGGVGSTNLPYFIYKRSIGGGWRFGQASAYSVVVVVAFILLATFGLRKLSGLLDGADEA